MKELLFLLLLVVVAFSACKKQDQPSYTPPSKGTAVAITGAGTANITVPTGSDSAIVYVNSTKLSKLTSTASVTFVGGSGTIISAVSYPSLGVAKAVVK